MRFVVQEPKIFFLILFLNLFQQLCNAQITELDSLKKLLIENYSDDTKELQLLNSITPVQVNISPSDALANTSKAIALAQKLNNQKELAVAYNNKGFIHLRKSEYAEANIFLKKSLSINTDLQNQFGIADNLTNTAEILRRQGETDSAKTMFEKALHIYQQQKNINGIADVYYYLGLTYRDLSDNKNTLLFNEEAIELYKQAGNENGLALAINASAGYYYRTGNLNKAIDLGNLAIKINERIGNLYGLALDYGNMGIDYADFPDYPRSLDLSLKALRINEQMENHHMVANTYISIGTSYFELKQFNKALDFIKKGTDLFEKLKINNGQYRMGCNYLGIIYLNLNDTKKSFVSLYKALEINSKAKDDWALSDCYIHLGEAYLQTKNYDSSIFCFTKGLVIDTKNENLLSLGIEYVGLAKSLVNASEQTFIKSGIDPQNKKFLIASYLEKAIAIGYKSENKKTLRDAYEELSKFNEARGNVNMAFECYRKFVAYKDSIMNNDNSNAISILQLQYDTEKKEQQIKLLTKESQLQQTELQKQDTTRNVFIAALGLIALLAGIMYNRYRIKQKANAEIETTLQHLKNTQEQLIEHEKLASLGKFTAQVAGEIEVPVKHINQLNQLNRTLMLNIKNNSSTGDAETLKNNLQHIFNYGKEADAVVKKVLTETRKLQS